MSTTPTTPSALQAMVEALRKLAVIARGQRDWGCMAVAENALDAWGKRPRLDQDEELLTKLTRAFADQVGAGDEEASEVALWLLGFLEPLLYGERG